MRRLLLLAALAAAACDGPAYDPPKFTPVLPDASTVGLLRGEVRYEGPPPERRLEPMGGNPECVMLQRGEKVPVRDVLVRNGRLQNVFVHIKSGLDAKYAFPIPADPHVVSNERCLYVPRVSGARTWQRVRLVNMDPTAHNFRSNDWSKTLSSAGQETVVWFSKPQRPAPLRCDLHNWMIGHLWVLDHPYFAVSAEDGTFLMQGVPPGEYTVEAWHETLGPQTQTVKLEPRGEAALTFTFKR